MVVSCGDSIGVAKFFSKILCRWGARNVSGRFKFVMGSITGL
jgi:hypothetical protein